MGRNGECFASSREGADGLPPSWSYWCCDHPCREALGAVDSAFVDGALCQKTEDIELYDASVGSNSPAVNECRVDSGSRELRRSSEEAVLRSEVTTGSCCMLQLDAISARANSDSDSESEGSVNQPWPRHDEEEDIVVTHQQLLPPWPVLHPSEDIGVTYHKKSKQWKAHLWLNGRQLAKHHRRKDVQIFLGRFKSKDEAKAAHDKAAIRLNVRETTEGTPYPLNFSESTHARFIKQHWDWSTGDFVWKIRRFSHKFSRGRSGMKGVTLRRRNGTKDYVAKITRRLNNGTKVTFGLGKFECAEEAGKAYDRALLFFTDEDSDRVTNFRPSSYSGVKYTRLESQCWKPSIHNDSDLPETRNDAFLRFASLIAPILQNN